MILGRQIHEHMSSIATWPIPSLKRRSGKKGTRAIPKCPDKMYNMFFGLNISKGWDAEPVK
jgi:hypothetical protein